MTDQELFDKVAKHLLKQNRCSESPDGLCMYRGPRRAKCAAGVLIKDEFYSKDLEGSSVESSPKVRTALIKSGVRRSQLPLVTELQLLHDNDLPNNWAYALKNLASRYDL